MEILETVGQVLLVLTKMLLLVVAVGSVALTLYRERKRMHFTWSIWKRFSFLMLAEVLAVLTATLVFCFTIRFCVPWLWVGWLDFFIQGGGNISIGPVLEGRRSSYLIVRLLVPIFFTALLLVIPFLAKVEEEWFRKGNHEWKTIWRWSLMFGFVHCIVGVPFGAGLALSGVGLFYAWKYHSAYVRFRQTMPNKQAEEEAVLVSTAYHALYNSIVIGMMLLLTTLLAIANQ